MCIILWQARLLSDKNFHLIVTLSLSCAVTTQHFVKKKTKQQQQQKKHTKKNGRCSRDFRTYSVYAVIEAISGD